MRIAEHTIEEIAEHSRIEDIVGQYTALEKRGGRLWGLCPFHNEKTASFSVNPEKGLFYCFGCQKGGTVFNFIMEAEQLSFVEAVQFLAKKAGIEVATGNETTQDTKKRAILELYNRVAGSFHYILMHSKEAVKARAYLSERKINEESIIHFEIGWAPHDRFWLYDFLTEKNYSTDFLKETGLFSKKNEKLSLFRGRLMFPIRKGQGQTIGFGGRRLEGDGPKYINSPETGYFKKRENLYGLEQSLSAIRKSGRFVLAEGYIDVITLYQAGITNSVAPLGTSFTEEQARLLKRYANEGIIFFDGDDAGKRATKKALFICEEQQIDCYISVPPAGKDPADIFLSEGGEALKKIVKSPINSVQFLLNINDHNRSDEPKSERKHLLEEFFFYIDTIQTEVKREFCIKEFAENLGIDQKSLWTDYLSRKQRKKQLHSQNDEKKWHKISPELYLMIAIIENHDYFTIVRNKLEPDELQHKDSRQLFYILEDAYRKGEVSLNSILEKLENNSVKNIILEKLSSNEFQINKEQVVKDTIRQIKKQNYERKKADVIQKIAKLEKTDGDERKITELQSEMMYIDQELEKLRVTPYV